MLHNNLDILLISETKIDSSFPTAQFQIEGYTTYRLDRNTNGGGILLYIREDIPSTLLNSDISIESFSIEINIRKKKWLLVCTYNPNKNLISNHLKEIGKKFDKSSLKLIHSYLSNRKQRVKVNDRYSSWSEILFGVSQGSILGPLMFNIFIWDMFYFLEDFDIANYADDSTPYCAGKSAEFVGNSLEQSSAILFEWLNNNYMKVNTGIELN